MTKKKDETTIGEESFLDTMANLVGVLIIMIVVVGARASVDAVTYGRGLSEAKRSEDLGEQLVQARGIEDSLVAQMVAIEEYELETEYRRLERNGLLEKVHLAREATQQQLDQLDGKQRAIVEQDQKIEKLKDQVERANEQLSSGDGSERPEVILEHLPTPMARTVFQKEMHVMLRGGRLTVIPWDRLIEVLKQQIPLAAQRQASRGKLEDTIGPVSGFLLKYRMIGVPAGFELDRFELEPTESAVSESLEDALQEASRLGFELSNRNPRETVVTVWVYPDSFDDFRLLKSWLFANKFLCAARPLPSGVRIGASPHGTKSSSQ